MSQSFSRTIVAVALATLLSALPGCGYTLRGKVVRGETSGIEMVHEMDQRLKGPGLANVDTLVRRDPQSASPQLVGRQRTDAGGNFSMPISEFGAGWMQEQWQVQARIGSYQNASSIMKLPAKGSKWRLLITLAPGTATPLETGDEVVEDLERFGSQ